MDSTRGNATATSPTLPSSTTDPGAHRYLFSILLKYFPRLADRCCSGELPPPRVSFTSRTVQDSPRPLLSHHTIAEGHSAIDDNVPHSDRILVRSFKARTIRNRLLVENHDIRFHS